MISYNPNINELVNGLTVKYSSPVETVHNGTIDLYQAVKKLAPNRIWFEDTFKKLRSATHNPDSETVIEVWLLLFKDLHRTASTHFYQVINAFYSIVPHIDSISNMSVLQAIQTTTYLKTLYPCIPENTELSPEFVHGSIISAIYFGLFYNVLSLPLEQFFMDYEGGWDYSDLQTIIRVHGSDYESPGFLLEMLCECGDEELNLLHHLNNGHSLRDWKGNTYSISQKEAHLILNNNLYIECRGYRELWTYDITVTSNRPQLLLKNLILARLTVKSNIEPGSTILTDFLRSNRLWEENVDEFFNQIDYWASALRIAANLREEDYNFDVGHFSDFILDKTRNSISDYNLRQRTTKSIRRDIEIWGEELYLNDVGSSSDWVGLGFNDWYDEINGEEYRIVEIRNSACLHREGRIMSHCVYSLLHSCESGHSSIFSVQKKNNDSWKSHITLRVTKNRLFEAKLSRNRIPSQEDMVVVRIWGDEHGIGL